MLQKKVTQSPHVEGTERSTYEYTAKDGKVLDVSWTVSSGRITVATSTRNSVPYPTPQATTSGAPASKAGDSELGTKIIRISSATTGQVDVVINISEH